MTETVTRPSGTISKTCSFCGRSVRTKRFVSPGGEAFDLCTGCHPAPKKGGTPDESKKRSLYSDEVLGLIYRFGGATPRQLARLLVISVPEIAELDREARSRESRGERSQTSTMPSYRIARKTLEELRENKELETIRLKRGWLSTTGRGKASGRLETFYRFPQPASSGKRVKSVASRAVVVEAGNIAGGKEGFEDQQYRLHWSGGAKESGPFKHSAHRTDLLIQLVESLNPYAGLNHHGAAIDFDSVFGESHPEFPLICSELEKRNAAGDPKYVEKNQKKSNYRNTREFERVVPDLVMEITFGAAPSSTGFDEPETDTNLYGGFDEGEWETLGSSRTGAGEGVPA